MESDTQSESNAELELPDSEKEEEFETEEIEKSGTETEIDTKTEAEIVFETDLVEKVEVVSRQVMNAFEGQARSYIVMAKDEQSFSTGKFFSDIKSHFLKLLYEGLKDYAAIKLDAILFGEYMKPASHDEILISLKSFQSKLYHIDRGADTDGFYTEMVKDLHVSIDEFYDEESGWALVKICYLELNLHKYQAFKGSSYIPLPNAIRNRNACINVKNTDEFCFKWAIISALRYNTTNSHTRTSSYGVRKNRIKKPEIYLPIENITLNFNGLDFPLPLESLKKFEEHNEGISINVFGLEKHNDSHQIIGPYYSTRHEKSIHINLLFIHDESHSNFHYVWIRNLSRLASTQLSRSQGQVHICNSCLHHFPSEEKRTAHKEECGKIIYRLPAKEDATEEFKLYKRKLTVPFVIYANFQYILTDVADEPSISPLSDNSLREHVPCAASYFVKCSFDSSHDRLRTFYGKSCIDEFMQDLVSYSKDVFKNVLKINRKYLPLTKREIKHQRTSPICYICNKVLDLINRNYGYCHLSGRYMGPVHYECSMVFTLPEFFPIFFHHLTDLDLQLLTKHLDKYPGLVTIHPLNETKYISLSKKLQFDDNKFQTFHLRFLDYCRFLNTDLRSLAVNLSEKDFETIKTVFSDPCTFIQRKGVFPYEHINSWDRLDETGLPSQDSFDNKLSGRECSTEDYDFAKTAWTHFNCSTLKDYTLVYLRNNVLLLAAIFEYFRNVCIESYELDPAQYYTIPEYTWQAMLKITNVKLELFTDIDMYNFVKAGIRGGLTHCAHRHALANNKYMQNYDPSKESQFILHLKANNLYSWAMTQYLPYSNFEWNENLEMNFTDVPDDNEIGYILEVDLEYPRDLHNEHNDLPFCPINWSSKKLVSNLNSKLKYIIHYKNLHQCLKYGLKLKKIHRILQFKQSAWLKPFIERNIKHQERAINKFEINVHEIINKALYAMTMEKAENRKHVRIARAWEKNRNFMGARAYIALPNIHSITYFKDNLSFAQLNQSKITYNEPIYFGFSVLELSKFKMYEFHYGYMKSKYEKELALNYFDKDSFIYTIKTNDFYADIKEDIPIYFDTSDYSIRNPYNFPQLNDEALGLMKDEKNGQIIVEYVGLGPNAFSCKTDNFSETEKPKIVKINILDNISLLKCVSSLLNDPEYYKNMNRNELHNLYTRALSKLSVGSFTVSRFNCSDKVNTLAWGHYRIQ